MAVAPAPVRAAAAGAVPARATGADTLAQVAPHPAGVEHREPARAEPAAADSVRRRPWHEQPRFVMARSLLVPGWGQLHNHAWIKAVVVAGVEGWIGTRILQDQHQLDGLFRDIDRSRVDAGQALADRDTLGYESARAREVGLVNEYNIRLDQRLSRQWMLGGVIAYALVDAFVDANFHGFDVEFRNDPALPAGTSPAGSISGGDGAGMRLALRWHF